MSWLLTAAAVAYAVATRAVLGVSRARVAKWQERAARAEFDLHFAVEKLAEALDREREAERQWRAN